jgi:hypothetical protein
MDQPAHAETYRLNADLGSVEVIRSPRASPHGPAHSTVEAVEGNDMVEGRGRPAGTTLEAAKSQTQRWQPLLPNLQRVNAAASATGRTRFTALLLAA